jgi:GAF domain-containing protein
LENPEQWLAETFVELADTLVDEFDVVDFLSGLTDRCAELLDATEVGLVIADASGRLHVMASSSERMRILELFEIQSDEGPCLDAFRTGEQVINVKLASANDRWPAFAPRALAEGFTAAHALPMKLRDDVIGALNVFDASGRHLEPGEIRLAQALADTATIGLLQERAVHRATVLAEQLQTALNTRVVVEQAKGVVAEQMKIDVGEAFELLRGYARRRGARLGNVVRDVVEGRLPASALVQGAKS